MRFYFIFLLNILFFPISVFSQDTLRGEVCVETEPVYAIHLGVSSPLSTKDISLWALQDAQSAFSAMIYGWEFEYEPGERVRRIQENISLFPLGEIPFGDENLSITDAGLKDGLFFMSADYNLNESQSNRLKAWYKSPSSSANTTGFGPLLGNEGISDRRSIKQAALEDAVQKALRAKLRQIDKNRPRAAKGLIALSKFPVYRMNGGVWACTASFRIIIKEIEHFSAY